MAEPGSDTDHGHVGSARPVSDVVCPLTHFLCASSGYCLPVYVRCNGVVDCPSEEDELHCSSYTCPGFYRCRGSSMCVHPENICDNTFHCPQQDDELMCTLGSRKNYKNGTRFVCPEDCLCLGLAFVCAVRTLSLHAHPGLRYLDAAGTLTAFETLARHDALIHLSLARCNIVHLPNITFLNLHSLDLSDNHITGVRTQQLTYFPNVKALFLAGNPLVYLFDEAVSIGSLVPFPVSAIQTLDLSGVLIPELCPTMLANFPQLQSLNVSQCQIQTIPDGTFHTLMNLRVLDIRGCPVREFPPAMIKHLNRLQLVHADNYKLCCPATLPDGFNPNNCRAPFDEVSSCETLLRADVYRVVLSMFATLALVGNLGSFIVRVCVQKNGNLSSFSVFVTHLSIADFLMGVYLAIIGMADRLYQGTYLWQDNTWRHSVACQMAGFLSLLSSEVSAFIILLVTLDRFLVLRFPFSQLHFHAFSAKTASALVWFCGGVIASIPMLPFAADWQFYSHTGICIPLPITRTDFPGHHYSFAVIVIVNFALFLLLAAGQASIYASVRANSMTADDSSNSTRSQDRTVARRLISVAMSDFFCWFPIGLLGLLASQGVAIPGEVNVGMAIFVLPLNAALNPFLYTFNMILERRRRVKEERMLKLLRSVNVSKAKATKLTDLA